MDEIIIEAEPVKTLPVNLVGERYDIKPPKAALAMRLAIEAKVYDEDPGKMMAVLDSWIARAFGKKGAKAIHDRIEDDDDDLDIVHIMALMEKVTEAQTGNPTS